MNGGYSPWSALFYTLVLVLVVTAVMVGLAARSRSGRG
jgi:hypothetical protein